MLPRHNNPQIEQLMSSLTLEELRTEGVAAALDQCDYTANVRSQIGSVLDIYRGFDHTAAFHRVIHEAVLARTASTVMYSVLPFTNVEALTNIVAEDKEELLRRVDEVASHWAELVPTIADKVKENAVMVKAKFAALVDSIVGTADIKDLEERMNIMQKAFAEGAYDADGSGAVH